jgi:crotonobetainyl-CoA hydratase
LSFSDVVVERVGHVVVITLNRPGVHNAMTGRMATVIGTTLVNADADKDVRAVVITGAGGGERQTFCSGGDLAAIRNGESIHSSSHPEWGFAGCRRNLIGKPMIAAVNGSAIGGGFEIVLACDIAIAADTAWFCLPEGRHGFAGNPGGAYRLAHQMPPAVAREYILTGRRLTAHEALRWGLVNDVVPVGEVLPRALRLAAEIAARAPLSTAATKRVAVHPVGEWAAVGYDERTVWQWWADQPG